MRVTLSIVLSCLTAAVAADEVYLQNGDRVSGTLLSVTAEAVRLETNYAGEIAIAREAVTSLMTEHAMTITLHDGGVITGRLIPGEAGQMVDDGSGVGPVPLDRIAVAVPPGVAPSEEASPEVAPSEAAAEEPAEAPSPWSGTIESGLTLRRGNTDTMDFTLGAKAVRKTEKHELSLKAAGAYGEADGVINTQKLAGEARWQVYMSERAYVYALGGAERDDGRKLDLRLSGALGAGRDFIVEEERSLSADLGFEYTWERWAPFTPWGRDEARREVRSQAFNGLVSTLGLIGAGGVTLDNLELLGEQLLTLQDPLRGFETREEEHLSLRLGLEYTQQVFEHSTLSETLTLYPNLEELGEFRGISEFAFATPLTEKLKLSVTLRTEYDSMAEEQDVDPWDNTLITGLRYEF